tara:strand:+ start:202 stop:399 length:198 start_codon:yes stop_codon:yes gene_type:complete
MLSERDLDKLEAQRRYKRVQEMYMRDPAYWFDLLVSRSTDKQTVKLARERLKNLGWVVRYVGKKK